MYTKISRLSMVLGTVLAAAYFVTKYVDLERIPDGAKGNADAQSADDEEQRLFKSVVPANKSHLDPFEPPWWRAVDIEKGHDLLVCWNAPRRDGPAPTMNGQRTPLRGIARIDGIHGQPIWINLDSRCNLKRPQFLSWDANADGVQDYIGCEWANGNLVCLSGADGQILWDVAPFASQRPNVNGNISNWTEVFELIGDRIVVAALRADIREANLASVSARDGSVIWQTNSAADVLPRLLTLRGQRVLATIHDSQLKLWDLTSGRLSSQSSLPISFAPAGGEESLEWVHVAPTYITPLDESDTYLLATTHDKSTDTLILIQASDGATRWSRSADVHRHPVLYRSSVELTEGSRVVSKVETYELTAASLDGSAGENRNVVTRVRAGHAVDGDTLLCLQVADGAVIWDSKLPQSQSSVSPNDRHALKSIGDVDGDQVADIVIVSPIAFFDESGKVDTAVSVHSGADGRVVWSTKLPSLLKLNKVNCVHAITGSRGTDALVVGFCKPNDKQGSPQAWILNAATGTKLQSVDATHVEVCDLNGDGLQDLCVGNDTDPLVLLMYDK